MERNKDMPFDIYKDGELVAQSLDQQRHEAWLEHYRSHYPDSKITTERLI